MSVYFSPQRRRRLAPLLLVLGALLFGKMAYEEVPQEQRVRFSLSPAQQSTAQSVRITYITDGDVFSGLEQHFPQGAPPEIMHSPSLRPGRYAVSIDLVSRTGEVTRVQRALEVPSQATTRISLAEGP